MLSKLRLIVSKTMVIAMAAGLAEVALGQPKLHRGDGQAIRLVKKPQESDGASSTDAWVTTASSSDTTTLVTALQPPANDDGAAVVRSLRQRPFQKIAKGMLALERRYPGWASTIDYGYTHGGRVLRLVKLASPAPSHMASERPAALIMGAIHGDEFLAVEDQIAEGLLTLREKNAGLARFFAAGGIVYVVPVVNPDGYDRDRRTNNRNVDLNRDFPPAGDPDGPSLREPESRSLVEAIDRELEANQARLRISFDYHCCSGAVLYPWSHGKSKLAPEVLAAHERVAKLAHLIIDPSYGAGTTESILGYSAKGTAKDYFFARYGALSFTYEGQRMVEKSKVGKHVNFWTTILASLTD